MKRWLVILLMVLLPLQTVAASRHTCASAEQPLVSIMHVAGQSAQHTHSHANLDDSGSLCTACSLYCHAQPATFNTAPDLPRDVATTHPSASPLHFHYPTGTFTRIERPKWHPSA